MALKVGPFWGENPKTFVLKAGYFIGNVCPKVWTFGMILKTESSLRFFADVAEVFRCSIKHAEHWRVIDTELQIRGWC